MDLSYKEKQEKLNIRIRAHKQFANFDIADWIETFILRKPRECIFDLGCGNGNHIGLYLKHIVDGGKVYGLDREPSLIEEARNFYSQASNLFLTVGSMDEILPFEDQKFDLCFSNFAIYNACDPRKTLLELKRIMKKNAELVLIGPTQNNAIEIYEFNARLTGRAIDQTTLIRTNRLKNEILPVARDVFGFVQEEVINSYLSFPDKNEFISYFQSTMLFEEVAEKQGVTIVEMEAACLKDKDIRLSKEMLALVATNQ